MADDITAWIEKLAGGDSHAAEKIWGEFRDQLARLARAKLGDRSRRATDESDVALSAYASFCKGLEAGRFPRLSDRDDLRKVLLTIVARKATAHVRRECRQKRGGGAVRGESVLVGAGRSGGAERAAAVRGAFSQMPDAEPTAEMAASWAETWERLWAALEDSTLQTIARLRIEGYEVQEIAEQLDRSERTIKRRLAQIRSIWSPHLDLDAEQPTNCRAS